MWSMITHIPMICASCCWVFGAAPACCSDVALNEGVSPNLKTRWEMSDMGHACASSV